MLASERNSAMNLDASVGLSLTSRPMKSTSGCASEPVEMSGASERHGPHHDAHTLITSGRPDVSMRAVTSSYVVGVGGGGRSSGAMSVDGEQAAAVSVRTMTRMRRMAERLYRVVAYELWVDPGDRVDETVVLPLGPDGETEMVREELCDELGCIRRIVPDIEADEVDIRMCE
jgi:hypothetical protein